MDGVGKGRMRRWEEGRDKREQGGRRGKIDRGDCKRGHTCC